MHFLQFLPSSFTPYLRLQFGRSLVSLWILFDGVLLFLLYEIAFVSVSFHLASALVGTCFAAFVPPPQSFLLVPRVSFLRQEAALRYSPEDQLLHLSLYRFRVYLFCVLAFSRIDFSPLPLSLHFWLAVPAFSFTFVGSAPTFDSSAVPESLPCCSSLLLSFRGFFVLLFYCIPFGWSFLCDIRGLLLFCLLLL